MRIKKEEIIVVTIIGLILVLMISTLISYAKAPKFKVLNIDGCTYIEFKDSFGSPRHSQSCTNHNNTNQKEK